MMQPARTSSFEPDPQRFKVLIAGGGVAGLEAAFALHALAADYVEVTVLSKQSEFVYRPDAVKEPFVAGYAHRYPLTTLVSDAGAKLIHDELTLVDVVSQIAHTTDGRRIGYDALLLGLGAKLGRRYEHVTTVDDAQIDEQLHGLVQDVEEGYVKRLAFVIPAPIPWQLPAYELALQTAQRAWEMGPELHITILTPERAPLIVFGEDASREVAQQLADRGIEVITSAYCEIPKAKTINVSPGDRQLEFDRIVAMPELRGPALDGIPHVAGGFIPIDEYCHVIGAEHVFAAGDATAFPVKHGGIAAQQADIAAISIAASAGARIQPRSFDPVLEGVLFSGAQPRYFKAQLTGGHSPNGDVVGVPVPASTPKIATRFLAAHLEQTAPQPVAGVR